MIIRILLKRQKKFYYYLLNTNKIYYFCRNKFLMSEVNKNELIGVLKQQLSELITLFERTKEENTHLFNENQKLIKINKQKETELKTIQNKLETYKLSNAFIITGNGNEISEKKHDAKIKINRIVKEIDQCIALLNK